MSDEREAQGRFEEVLREAEPRPSAREEARPTDLADELDEVEPRTGPEDEEREPEPVDRPDDDPVVDEVEPDAGSASEDVLGDALDRLEASITLLLDRHRDLSERCASAEESGAEARRKLARLGQEGLDPDALERRIRKLEEENERVKSHAEHLEERIRGLLSRVRYVVEA